MLIKYFVFDAWLSLAPSAFHLNRSVSVGVAEFFGVTDEPSDEREKLVEKWRERTRRMHCRSVFLGGHKAPVDYSDVSTMGSSAVSLF